VTADQDGPIAIFHVDGFNVSTAASLRREVMRMRALHAAELKGVVLDLRDNPGGLLDQGAGVAAVFLNHGAITSIHGRNPSATQYFDASESDETRGLPMAVLVNGGSASASEIVAAALQDDRRAVVIGSSSYGKGTVQMVLRLENDGELTLTWARLYAPDGYLLHQHGVVPVFCTSHPVDPLAPQMEAPARMQAIIDEGLHPTGIAAQARASLSDADWQALRARCPPTNSDNSMDLALAERVLLDPALYAAAISPAGVAVAHVGHAPPSVLQ
jgi:carboxyl-terminal processing protease